MVLLDVNTTVAFFINVSHKCFKTDGKGNLRIRRDADWRFRQVADMEFSFEESQLNNSVFLFKQASADDDLAIAVKDPKSCL